MLQPLFAVSHAHMEKVVRDKNVVIPNIIWTIACDVPGVDIEEISS